MSMIGDRLKALEALEAKKAAEEAAAKEAAGALGAKTSEHDTTMSELGFTEKCIELGLTGNSIEIIKNLSSQETSFDSLQNGRTFVDLVNEILCVDGGHTFAALLNVIHCIEIKEAEKAKTENSTEIEWQILGLMQIAHEKMDQIISEIMDKRFSKNRHF